jgi:hypothetical protein
VIVGYSDAASALRARAWRRIALAWLALGASTMLALASCASVRTVALDASAIAEDSALASLTPAVETTPLEAGQWALEFTLSVPAERHDDAVAAARRIAAVGFALYRPPGVRVDTFARRQIAIDPDAPIVDGRQRIAETAVKWVQPGLATGTEYVVMSVWTDRGVVVRSTPLFSTWSDTADTAALTLALSSAPSDGGRRFILVVSRVHPQAGNEYVTSRTPYAIRIVDADGGEIWSSASPSNQTFIGPVLPDDATPVRYEATFDGIDRRSGRPLAPGRYRVIAEVRARPRASIIQQELDWVGREHGGR